MKRIVPSVLCALLFAGVSDAAVWSLSGSVVDAEGGAGLGQVQVRLAVAGLSTTTSSNGSWTLSTTSVGRRRAGTTGPSWNSLRLHEGRLSLSINGSDVLGRRLPETWSAPPVDLGLAARAQEAVTDTLVYLKSGYTTLRVPVTNSVQQGLVAQLRKQGGNLPPATDFTDTIKGVAIPMIRIPGGTFTLGCESGTCPADAAPVTGVKVSSYHIGKTEVSNALWNAVMGNGTHSTGYTTDYLYAVDADGTFYHNSFQAYERGDFRMFKKTANGSETFTATCASLCTDEIPKGQGASLYANMATGKSTFIPAPCPVGGCR